jgi:hypothetical protein
MKIMRSPLVVCVVAGITISIAFIIAGLFGDYFPAKERYYRQIETNEYIYNKTITEYKCHKDVSFGVEYTQNVNCSSAFNEHQIGESITCGNGKKCTQYYYKNCQYTAYMYIKDSTNYNYYLNNYNTIIQNYGLGSVSCNKGNHVSDYTSYNYICTIYPNINDFMINDKLNSDICVSNNCGIKIELSNVKCDKMCASQIQNELTPINITVCHHINVQTAINTTWGIIITNTTSDECLYNNTDCINNKISGIENSLTPYYYDPSDPLHTYSKVRQWDGFMTSLALFIVGSSIAICSCMCVIACKESCSEDQVESNRIFQGIHIIPPEFTTPCAEPEIIIHKNNVVMPKEPQVECPICLVSFGGDIIENVKSLECYHVFHTVCIDKWLQEKDICPVCRQPNLFIKS